MLSSKHFLHILYCRISLFLVFCLEVRFMEKSIFFDESLTLLFLYWLSKQDALFTSLLAFSDLALGQKLQLRWLLNASPRFYIFPLLSLRSIYNILLLFIADRVLVPLEEMSSFES